MKNNKSYKGKIMKTKKIKKLLKEILKELREPMRISGATIIATQIKRKSISDNSGCLGIDSSGDAKITEN